MVKKLRLSKLTNTQLLIAALVVSLVFIIVLTSIFSSPTNDPNNQPFILPPEVAQPILETNSIGQASPEAVIPQARYHDVSLVPNYVGHHVLTVPEMIRNQDNIIGINDLDALGTEAVLMLTDGILTYISLHQPPFLYRPIIMSGSLYFDPLTNSGGLTLIIANQQDTPYPDVRYNVSFVLEPPTMNFARQ
jgi:hypothetical protein